MRVAFVLMFVAAAAFAGEARFERRDGTEIAGEVVGLDLLTLTTAYGTLRVPIDDVLALDLTGKTPRLSTLRGVARGTVQPERLRVRIDTGVVELALAELTEITWTQSERDRRKDGIVAVLEDGTAMRGRLGASEFVLRTRYGPLRIPVAALGRVEREPGGAWRFTGEKGEARGTPEERQWILTTAYGTLRIRTDAIRRLGRLAAPTAGTELEGGHRVVAAARFRGHTYLLVRNEAGLVFHAARAVARRLDGDLVAIGSAEENRFVQQLALKNDGGEGHCWIGFTDEKQEGRFEWTNGERASYTNWDGGEPNNVGAGGEDATELITNRDGQWNDVSIGTRVRYWVVELW